MVVKDKLMSVIYSKKKSLSAYVELNEPMLWCQQDKINVIIADIIKLEL